MHNIVVIGAGQLGRRHIQSIANSALEGSLHIVDPSEASLGAARAALADCGGRAPLLANVHWHATPATLPSHMDLAVIATSADVRMDVLNTLCRVAPPRYLVLEKVLFQRGADYGHAAQLFTQHGITAWVNCPRRAMPVYQQLSAFFADDPVLRMDVFGGAWGLGCNGIHFLDLLAFLGGSGLLEVDASTLEPGVHPSKRVGFVEFAGTLRGKLGAAHFSLTSLAGSTRKLLIGLHGHESSVFIDEGTGTLWKHGRGAPSLEQFSLLYQSQLTGPLAESILRGGHCPLTPYAESTALHLPLLQALARHMGVADPAHDACPIT